MKTNICFVLFCLIIGSAAWAQYDIGDMQSNMPQLVSFHVGSASDFIAGRADTALSLGVSAGLMQVAELPLGIRVKYMYSRTQFRSSAVGAIVYGHIPFYTIIGPPVSVAFGGGGLFADANGEHSEGGYIETGIGLFKLFPINVDLLYRANFFPRDNGLRLDPVIHSISLVFTIL